ncbi:MAG: GNAT family N-acetyltransferase [Flavobacteriales bacterium]|nr:GNAT family N-acetyltransferase [Flavobacteriales bacterium]
MHMTPHLREAATDREWEQATALLQRVYVAGGYTAAANAGQFMTRENLEPAGVLLVALDGEDAVVGAVLLLHPASALRQLATMYEREFRVLGVDERARGLGIGEVLVQACVDRAFASGAQAVVLWTQPSMHSAQRLYKRLGFRRAPERDVEDPRGFTRLVFQRDL